MTAQEIVDEIEALGEPGYKRILLNHGAKEPCFGVKIEYLKKLQKRIKTDYRLSLDLFDTGIYDARYLAGLIADSAKMNRKDLQHWAETGDRTLCGSIIPGVAAASPDGWEIGMEWIGSEQENIAVAGWFTLSGVVGTKPDADLNLEGLKRLLKDIESSIQQQSHGVRYAMNAFVIAVGCYVKALTLIAISTAERIGKVSVDMGNTACQVPNAPEYIRKVQQRGTIGKKRKTTKC